MRKKLLTSLITIILLFLTSLMPVFAMLNQSLNEETSNAIKPPPTTPERYEFTLNGTVSEGDVYIKQLLLKRNKNVHFKLSVNGGSAVNVYILDVDEDEYDTSPAQPEYYVENGEIKWKDCQIVDSFIDVKDLKAHVSSDEKEIDVLAVTRPIESTQSYSNIDLLLGTGGTISIAALVIELGGYMPLYVIIGISTIAVSVSLIYYKKYKK